MPADPQIPPPTSRPPRATPPQPPWFPWKSILLVSGLMLGVFAVLETPREIGRWHLAAAREHWRDAEYGEIQGDLTLVAENRQKAFAKLDDALKWSPQDLGFLWQRAEWRIELGEYEGALLDSNRLLESFPDDLSLLRLRGKTLHLLARHVEAVKDAEHINNLSKTSGNPQRAVALNEVAYSKAVGKIELESALKEVNEALKSERHAAFLDTRGFVYYQMGKYDLALKDLESAANQYEAILKFLAESAAKRRKGVPDIRKEEVNARKDNEGAAVVLYHRALAHEKLGHAAAAAADRKRVRELIGRDGDEKLF